MEIIIVASILLIWWLYDNFDVEILIKILAIFPKLIGLKVVQFRLLWHGKLELETHVLPWGTPESKIQAMCNSFVVKHILAKDMKETSLKWMWKYL